MTIAITAGDTWQYITLADRELPEEQQTVWTLRVLDGTERQHLKKGVVTSDSKAEEFSYSMGPYVHRCMQFGLAGVENFPDGNGALVKFATHEVGTPGGKKRRPTDEFIGRIPDGVQVELAEAIDNNTRLDAGDVKN